MVSDLKLMFYRITLPTTLIRPLIVPNVLMELGLKFGYALLGGVESITLQLPGGLPPCPFHCRQYFTRFFGSTIFCAF